MRARPPPKANRRRFVYTPNDQRRWLSIGALLVASAAALGYIYGQYSEKHKKHGITHTFSLTKSGNNNNNNTNNTNTNKEDMKQNCQQIEYERNYRILIYGDSTTWGYDPDTQTRLEPPYRYPCVLEQLLNNKNNINNIHKVEVIPEGLSGRTISHRDLEGNPKNERRKLSMNGLDQILPILYSHKPIDIIILLLGINDCKSRFNPSSNKIASNMNKLIKKCINAEIWPVQENKVSHGPRIILISPPYVRHINEMNKLWTFNNSSINVSQSLHTHYSKIKQKYDKDIIYFINANKYIETGSDSVHIDGENNIKLANVLYPVIIDIINKLQFKSRKFSVPSFTSASLKHGQLNTLNNEQEIDNEDDGSIISELEQERNGDTVIIKDININDNEQNINIIDSNQCNSNDKKST